MEYQAKFDAYQKLKGVDFLEADKTLLEKKKPNSKALRNLANPDKESVQRDILWDLLEVAHPAEILENRGQKTKGQANPQPKELTEEDVKKLTQDLLDGVDVDYAQLKSLVKHLDLVVKNNKKDTLIQAVLDHFETDPDPEPKEEAEEETEESPETPSGEGEKNQDAEPEGAEGAGVSDDPMDGSGESGDPEGADPVQRPGELPPADDSAGSGAGGESDGEEDSAAGGTQNP